MDETWTDAVRREFPPSLLGIALLGIWPWVPCWLGAWGASFAAVFHGVLTGFILLNLILNRGRGDMIVLAHILAVEFIVGLSRVLWLKG